MRAALASVALLIALPAQATWRSAQIAGTPSDVDAPDAGVAIVSSGTAAGFATLFSGDSASGFTPQLSMAGDFKSATWRPPSCLIGLAPNATMQFSAGCPTPGITSLAGIAVFAGRVRKQPSGAICAYVWNTTATFLRMQCAGPTAGSAIGDWALLGAGQTPNTESPMSTVTLPGGAEYLAYGHTIGTLGLYVDGGLVGSFAGSAALRDVALFDHGGRPGAIVLTDAGTLTLRLDVVDGGLSPINVPQRPYRTVSFHEAGGSANGRGFGMLTVGNEIYSPVPNPNAVGRDWVRRTEDAGFLGNSLIRATCYDPSFCAAITGASAGQNVFAYFNDSAPLSDLRAAQVAAGGSALYVLDAGDPDGDPIWVIWNDGGFAWDGGDPRTITVIGPPPAPGCGATPTAAPLIATLSDGLAAHDRQIVIPVTVTGGAASLPPLASMPASLAFTAGDLPSSVTASYPADSGCVVPALTWSIAPDGGLFGLAPSGPGVSVTPPTVFCRSTPQTFTLTASGASDASVSVPVTVSPWGNPNPPVFQPASVSQPAGTTVAYAPDASSAHACDGTSGFPGTDLIWTVDGGAPGVTVMTGGTQALVSSTNACISGTVVLQATRRVIAVVPVQASATQTLAVQLVPDWSPITAATAFDAGFTWNPAMSQLAGNFSTGANCVADRDLRAEVVVTASDGGLVNAKAGLSVPGPWFVDVPGGCGGGSFLASASLIDDAGVRYGQTASYAFDAGRIAARVPELRLTTQVPVTCAEGARGELELDLLPTDCAVQQFSWQQDRGPALVIAPDGGARVSFATTTQDLQAQAGQQLGWSITATVGPGNSAVASRSIQLVPAPFVQIAHRTDVPIAREEEAVGVEVILTNPTACAVSGLVLRESLGGLQPIPGSVRVAGVKVDETISAGVLEVRDLSLPALSTIKVRYLAKVPLLSRARPSAQVLLSGTDVTVPVVRPAATGCGCDAASPGAFALLALGAALVRSRRRSG